MMLFSLRKLNIEQPQFGFSKIGLFGLIFLLGFLVYPKFSLAQEPIVFEEIEQQIILDSPFTHFPSLTNNKTTLSQPSFKGEAPNDTIVEIYIDGEKDGVAQVKNGDLYTGYFTYRVSQNLKSGRHFLNMRSMDKNEANIVSEFTSKVYFNILHFPAPTLFTPVVRDFNPTPEILILGVAKNDSTIKVFVDNNLDGKFQVENHPSGTTDFAYVYRPVWELAPGEHIIYTTATDPRGKESIKSQMIFFEIAKIWEPVKVTSSVVKKKTESEKIASNESEEALKIKEEIFSRDQKVDSPEKNIAMSNNDLENTVMETEEILDNLIVDEIEAENNFQDLSPDKRQRNVIIGLIILALIIIVSMVSWFLRVHKKILDEKVNDILEPKDIIQQDQNKEDQNKKESQEKQPTLWE